MRTWFEIKVLMAMPLMCRNARPFITHPIIYPEDYVAQIKLSDTDVTPAPHDHPHAIHLALEWREALRADPNLTMAELARQKGLSRARITQILNILRLPAAIVRRLTGVRTTEEARQFPEHALRTIRRLKSPEEQHAAFRVLRNSKAESDHLGPPQRRSMPSAVAPSRPELTRHLGPLVPHATRAAQQFEDDHPAHGGLRDAENQAKQSQNASEPRCRNNVNEPAPATPNRSQKGIEKTFRAI
jgi:hypothetical protein